MMIPLGRKTAVESTDPSIHHENDTNLQNRTATYS